jgi:hypothetical protein
MPDGTHAGTGHDNTWLGLPGTNGSPWLIYIYIYIYIYKLYIRVGRFLTSSSIKGSFSFSSD